MPVLTLKSADSNSTARICVDRGFNCFSFQADVDGRMVDVIDSVPGFEDGESRVSGNGTPILFPFPNRIRAGQYSWNGRDYQMPPELVGHDQMGNAIHGFVIDRAWRVVEQGQNFAVGEFQLSIDAPDRRDLWPADFILRCRYELSGSKLRSEFEIVNPDSVDLPWGLGTHTYFKVPLQESSNPEKCLLIAPPSKQYSLIDCLPTGETSDLPASLPLKEGLYFGSQRLDDVFGGVPNDLVECLIMDEVAGLQVVQRNPGSFRDLVIYTPPNRNAVCFEPYTCITDAINLQNQGIDAGWQSLAPGASTKTWIDIEAGLVVA